MGFVGNFSTEVIGLKFDDKVVARTDRGVELARVVSQCEVIPDGADEGKLGIIGEVLRRMTPEDQEKARVIEEENQPAEHKFCQKRVQERQLPMKLAGVEHLFGGTKIIFYFLADGRVDFRELVKDLAQEYHCRIELRQIGVRDEARLLADYEHCGQPLCCRTFVKKLEPVTMKMAKSQKATLDPAKISGRCGRLMCCLRFEDATYDDLRRGLPPRGSRVVTNRGSGIVVDHELLRQLVKIETDQGQDLIVTVAEIRSVEPPKSGGGNSGRNHRRRPRNGRETEPADDDRRDAPVPDPEPGQNPPTE